MTTRRNFIKTTATLGLIPLVPVSMLSSAAEQITGDDPAAKALRYVEDATTAVRADKMGVAGADQLCSNCQFYTVSGSNPALGPCMLFQNKLVVGAGWCAGWVPKR
ncbi:MAG: High potential iron-sulfur protein [Gammaproteobacteria bacterium]|nr:High potential iron-sulfur protein [Gammaproteobacteria bacterium]